MVNTVRINRDFVVKNCGYCNERLEIPISVYLSVRDARRGDPALRMEQDGFSVSECNVFYCKNESKDCLQMFTED